MVSDSNCTDENRLYNIISPGDMQNVIFINTDPGFDRYLPNFLYWSESGLHDPMFSIEIYNYLLAISFSLFFISTHQVIISEEIIIYAFFDLPWIWIYFASNRCNNMKNENRYYILSETYLYISDNDKRIIRLKGIKCFYHVR